MRGLAYSITSSAAAASVCDWLGSGQRPKLRDLGKRGMRFRAAISSLQPSGLSRNCGCCDSLRSIKAALAGRPARGSRGPEKPLASGGADGMQEFFDFGLETGAVGRQHLRR